MRLVLLLFMLLAPLAANAWWNEEWSYRKELAIDSSAAGGDIPGGLTNVPVLVRLHTGNFGYFLDVQPNGEDLRFVDGDDLTPLRYSIEKYDPVNEMALIWVEMPNLTGGIRNTFWMYYGNPTAVAGSETGGIYDADTVLAYRFDADGAPVDATAYKTQPATFTGQPVTAAVIGGGAGFDGEGMLQVSTSPVLTIDPETGWTLSLWVKTDQAQEAATLFEASDGAQALTLTVDGTSLQARHQDASGTMVETPPGPMLMPGNWQHVALVLTAERLVMYLNGAEATAVELATVAFTPVVTFGQSASSERGFIGEMDDIQLAKASRSADWIKLSAGHGLSASQVFYGEDGQQEGSSDGGHESYFAITMRNVTVDGWVVIVFLGMMGAVSWLVMASKGIVVSRTRRDNAEFINHFTQLGTQDVSSLDTEETQVDDDLRESSLLMALSGSHDHFQSSTLYRVYHSGVQEMQSRVPKAAGAQAASLTLSNQAINAIRASMDATLVRETQRLNSQMVLLTIAISGGPFLGLLGTVVGVMITFAAIAASGDVNINSIAPGIAAALLATVAGLVVAIPALFGYNYLGTRIKEIIADMHVFVDEFVTKIAEHHS
jgi:biopolymer transport protein ExbB